MKTILALMAAATLLASDAPAQTFTAAVMDRQSSESRYSYVVPGRVQTQSFGLVDCGVLGNSVNCSGSSTGSAVVTPPRPIAYSVMGATLTLGLPDGRVVVVNCDSKYALRFDYINRRSCRVPLADRVSVTFNGDAAKLSWSVSLDGRKAQSETYKILGIIEPEPAPPTPPKPSRLAPPILTPLDTARRNDARESLELLPVTPVPEAKADSLPFNGPARVMVRFVTPVKFPDRMDSIVVVENLETAPLQRFMVEVRYRSVQPTADAASGRIAPEIAAIGSFELPTLMPRRPITLRIPHRVVPGLTTERPEIVAKHGGGGVTVVSPRD
ncbi:MAG: hypothetical protein U0Q55_16270 [Vicinamibacterales bacterium]